MSDRRSKALKLSDAERDELVSHVLALRKDFVQELLRRAQVARTGVKSDLRDRLRQALEDGKLSAEDLVDFLDEAEPGGKQHVFLYRVDPALDDWRDAQA